MHTLPQKEMLTLDSLMGEPHINGGIEQEGIEQQVRRSDQQGHHARQLIGAASLQGGIVVRGAASLPRSIDFCILTGWPAETVVVVCVMEPRRFLDP